MNNFKIIGCSLVAAVGVGFGAKTAILKIYDHKYNNQIEHVKNLIKNSEPDRFERLIKEEKELGVFDSKFVFWGEAVKQINDSISNHYKNLRNNIKNSTKHI